MGRNISRRKLRHTPGSNLLVDSNDASGKLTQVCCGNGEDLGSLKGGINMFAELVKARMIEYDALTTGLLDVLFKSNPSTAYLDRQLEVSTKVADLILTSKVPEDTTIDKIVDQVFDHFRVNTDEGRPYEGVVQHLVFATIGWCTMLYTYQPGEAQSSPTPRDSHTPHSIQQEPPHLSKRPLGAVLRRHGLMPISCPPGVKSSQGSPVLLPVTHLNFFSLSKLGDVTVIWVNDLKQHCEFDRYSRNKELKLFRMPSFCASICLHGQDDTLIGRLSRGHICLNECRTQAPTIARAYLIEVLLSYRLLFGQHGRSRQVFNERERENAKLNGSIDPLLDALCGDKDMNGCIDIKELIRERGVYNADVNFPHLRERLLDLEDYSTSQRPRNLLEVWNDERDPEKLLTFRAVLIIGGVSILLSLVQVFVGFAQIAVSV
ncbi:hypothetical protein GGR51DRAFT_503593 [Nemania sp. FL0031]|nr:hypothetical protein GGR51DRAFT_503593 [Nemania sp. FL0031]